MIKSLHTLLLVLVLSFCAFAQEQAGESSFSDKIFVGGGFGASFGDYTYLNVSPVVGYRVTNRLSVGLRLMYQYTTFKYLTSPVDEERYNGHDFGISPFARFIVYGPLYLQAEYEYLNYDGLSNDGSTYRSSFDSFMAGGGIAQPVGRKVFFFISVLYNFSYDNFNDRNAVRVPYDSPWIIRIGVAGGF